MKREKENIPNQNNSTVIGNDPNINYSESSVNVNKNESNYSNEQNKLRDLEYSLMIYLTVFFGFFVNYIINWEIIKYRKKYVSKELKRINKEKSYNNIYSKDKRLFILGICIPYVRETILSLLIYSIFYNIVFKETKNKQENQNRKIEKRERRR